MNLKIVFGFLFIILCVFEESVGGVVGLEKKKSRENGERRLIADESTDLPRKKRTGDGSKHLAYLMNFRTGKNSGRKQIKNIESKTYVVDTNRQTKQLRRDRLLIEDLIKSMIERGLLEPVTNEHRESRRKDKRSFKTKRFQTDVHEVHHNRNAHRHNPHRVKDENIAERKHEPHPASRPTQDYTYDDGSESEEILLLEQVKDHEKTDLKGNQRENKKSCYSNVYKNVLEAFQEALKKQISTYKSCVCRHNKNRHSDKNSKDHKSNHDNNSKSLEVKNPTTTEIATTAISEPDHLLDVRSDQNDENQGPSALQETLLKSGDDVVCFHKENAVILTELLKYLKFNGTDQEDEKIIESQPFREDHRQPKEHHVHAHQHKTHHHSHSHGHKKNSASGYHTTHHNHQHNSHDRGNDRVSRHYNNLENSEEVDSIVIPNSQFQTMPLTTTARTPKYQENEIEETRALTDIMKMVATLQDMYKPHGHSDATNLVEESDEAPRFIKSDETSGSEFSGPDDNETSYAKFLNDELKHEMKNMFRGSKPTNEKPFQNPSGNSIQKPQRKNDFHTNSARKVRQDEGSSYESIRKSEKSIVQSSQKSKQQRSASRPSSFSKSSIDSRKKLSLAVQIPEASRGIVSKIKYELE